VSVRLTISSGYPWLIVPYLVKTTHKRLVQRFYHGRIVNLDCKRERPLEVLLLHNSCFIQTRDATFTLSMVHASGSVWL